jgi:hypothetical protein
MFSGTRILGTVGASTAAQYFVGSTLQIENSGTELIVQGPAVIWISGDLEILKQAKIRILSTGRLEIFVTGDIRVGGITTSTAGFVNETNDPKRLALFSISTNPSRSFEYYTTLDFRGVLYSSAAKIEFKATAPEIYGAILANNSIVFSGSGMPKIHYDTALQHLPKGWFKGVATPFIITKLTEETP